MCDAVTGGDQVPDQEENSLGSDSQPPPGQDPLERDLGGDSWEQGSGNEGATLTCCVIQDGHESLLSGC